MKQDQKVTETKCDSVKKQQLYMSSVQAAYQNPYVRLVVGVTSSSCSLIVTGAKEEV